MDAELRRNIETAIDKHNYDFLFSYLKAISTTNYKEICDFMISYLQRNSKSSNNFWELAQRCYETDFSLLKAFILRNNLKGIDVCSKHFRNIFHNFFSEFCTKYYNIDEIIQLMKTYAKLFDVGFLNDISKVSHEFYSPDQFLLTLAITGASQNDAIDFLMYNETLCSFFTLAYIVLDPNYNKKKKWYLLPKRDVLKITQDLRNSRLREAKFTSNVLLDACNHDAYNEAEDCVYDKNYKRFLVLFRKSNGKMEISNQAKQTQFKETVRKDWAIKDSSNDNCIKDSSFSPISGIATNILAFKNKKLALTDSFMGYAGGILYPYNVLHNGLPLPLEDACKIISLYERFNQKVGINVLRSITIKDKQYAIVTLNITAPYSDAENFIFKVLKKNEQYPIKVVARSPNFEEVKILTTNLRGFISHKDFNSLSLKDDIDTFKSKLTEKPSYIGAPLIFGSHLQKNIVADTEEEKLNKKRYENLFSTMEIQNLPGQDKQLIDVMLAEYPTFGTTTDNSIVEQKIICRFTGSDDDLKSINNLLMDNYWVSPRTYTANNVLYLFNKDSILIKIAEDNNEFYIDYVADAKKDFKALKELNGNKLTELKISGNNVRICGLYENIPSDYNADGVFTYINRLNEYYRIKYDVARIVSESINNFASDFQNQLQYLNYQIDKEKARTKYIQSYSPEKLHITSGERQGDSVALIIDMSATEFKSLQGGYNEQDSLLNEIRVNTLDSEGKIKDHCELKVDIDGKYVLHILGSHKNAAEYISTGITLQGDANVKHLFVQRDAIKNFVQDEDSLFRDLLGDEVNIPDISKTAGIKFSNPALDHVEDGNSQPIAVRKALSLDEKGILLIQGPPGTGKTTTIVEIIRQLVNQKRKVLVCSQSHAAVGNIYEKLKPYCDNILRVDEHEQDDLTLDTRKFNNIDYEQFLRNNILLMHRLENASSKEFSDEATASLTKGFNYSTGIIQEQYDKLHSLLIQYYHEYPYFSTEKVLSLLEYLAKEAKNISGTMLQTQVYQSKDVILGTCIGVGMNLILKDGAIHFDTVIIDEAAKANLAESIVPMQMGDRYVLVGDDNQLPPYVDREEIEEMLKIGDYSNDSEITVKKMIDSQNKSLFEYFHNHKNFPQECLVTLNYQYRMNPAIGDFISNLFYDGKIHNGRGTEKQELYLPGFDNPVTVIDTSNVKDNREERVGLSVRNCQEANYICTDILPAIRSEFVNNPELTLGIISPYASQCEYLRSLIPEKQIRDCVHTIDSIQGMEFDVVIFSFVRSFGEKSHKKVGFVDDMKRLNVSLSRAKRKLIVIGNMSTLTRPSAHFDTTGNRVHPLDVFKKLSEMPTKVSLVKTPLQKFLESGIKVGEVLQCSWDYLDDNSNLIKIIFNFNNNDYSFNFKARDLFYLEKKTNDVIFLKYIGLGKDTKPIFAFTNENEDLCYTYNEHNSAEEYNQFVTTHKLRSEVKGRIYNIVRAKNGGWQYFVAVDGYTGSFHSSQKLEVGSTHNFIYRHFDELKRFIGLEIK